MQTLKRDELGVRSDVDDVRSSKILDIAGHTFARNDDSCAQLDQADPLAFLVCTYCSLLYVC